MNPLDQLFTHLNANRRKAFIPFITAGDPDLDATVKLLREVSRRGASLIEVGFPYSDPIADGPVVQASYTRALDRGVRIDDIFACLHQAAATPPFADQRVPLVGMISYTLVHRRGPEAFLAQAQAAG